MNEAVARTEALIARRGKGYICVTGVHGIMEAQASEAFRDALNAAYLAVPDGMPTVWIGRLYGHKNMRRVYGPDLMLALCDRSQQTGYRHFLYGGKEGVAIELQRRLLERYPKLQIVGAYTPPFRALTENEVEQLRSQIATAKPDIVWVGLSTPKQERFMRSFLPQLETSVMIGVGAAFDVHTGRIEDAPAWIKQAGLQWLHRLFQEPQRLWRRYLVNNPVFVVKIVVQILGDMFAGGRRR
jgi:N-acetylglucosaminyldiphosphoundecaprenol N-acetyl-beta-D-mannosaminyltransferase